MIAYLDNSATTRQYDEVTDLMADVNRSFYGNPSSLHRMGLASEKLIKEARATIAKSIGADSSEIIFTSGGTESDNTVIMSCLYRKKEGSKIISTTVEHPAILEPLKRLEAEGFDVEYIGVDRHCNLDLDALKKALTPDTILISVMAVNNEVGTIMPISEIAKIKDEYNKEHGTKILLHTDAVQAYGKIKIDINSNFKGVDLISTSAHKIHGPKGMGFLYVRKGTNIRPFLLGGGQEKGFRSGTENTPGIVGLGKASELVTKNFDERVKKMSNCRTHLLTRLSNEVPNIIVNSPENGVCSVLNVSFMKTRGEVLLHSLEQNEIYVSTGSACASNHASSKGSHVLNAMGMKFNEIEGAIRFSLSEFTTIDEIDYAVDKVKESVEKFRKLGTFR